MHNDDAFRTKVLGVRINVDEEKVRSYVGDVVKTGATAFSEDLNPLEDCRIVYEEPYRDFV